MHFTKEKEKAKMTLIKKIGAAAAGLAGEKASKDGVIPGLDLTKLLPAVLGSSGGNGSSIAGTLVSAASKLLGGSNKSSTTGSSSKLGNLASLAGSLFSIGKSTGTTANKAASGIEALAAAIASNAGSGSNLGKIATMAATLAKTVKTKNELTGLAGELGSTLASKFGVSLNGGGTVIKALEKATEKNDKTELFTAVLKGLVGG